uniref:Large ribosomal subunit protein mL37 n=1 Tax=Lygus hesperus TaxID=30085 RepID=A0A0K8TE31_LYGHE
MRATQVLLQQHHGRMFRRHWKLQGHRKLIDNGALKSLKERGIQVENALDVVNDKVVLPHKFPLKPLITVEVSNAVELVQHFIFDDSNVLVSGLDHAKNFTNSIEILSESLNVATAESDFSRHDLVKRCIKSSLLYDAYQEKLPKRTDPERPAWNFPRDYGITDRRRNLLLCNRMIQLCSSLNPQLLAHRRTLSDATFRVPLERDGEKVLMSLRADILLTSSEELEAPSTSIDVNENKKDEDVPDLHPMTSTVSLTKEITPVNQLVDSSPFVYGFSKCNVHTAIVHYNSTETANIHDLDVSQDQFLSRSLMKAYAFALAEARRRYGADIENLPHPVTVQCVHTDSKDFHFAVLQLNTVKDNTLTDERNFYWSLPIQTLYETCEYSSGKPVIEGYNPSVFNTLLAFCRNN